MGVPEGGRSLALLIALELDCEFIYPEKKVLTVGTGGRREQSELAMNRHEIEAGTGGVIVEDVCNNFSSTAKILGVVEGQGAEAVAIACAFNRSGKDVYEHSDRALPVLSVAQIPAAQYRQDDPFVIKDVEAGNVVWKPKAEWARLQKAMADFG
jgi:orotate phosphoribosyltransferase